MTAPLARSPGRQICPLLRFTNNGAPLVCIDGRMAIAEPMAASNAIRRAMAEQHDALVLASRQKQMEWLTVQGSDSHHYGGWVEIGMWSDSFDCDRTDWDRLCVDEVCEPLIASHLVANAKRELQRSFAAGVVVIVSGNHKHKITFVSKRPPHQRIIEQLRSHQRRALFEAVVWSNSMGPHVMRRVGV